ncbi:MAG: carboxylesterase, partial [Betaproteobacteria bacterium]|nr:carboxylesterase [Betaproteobacteria bacterium]
ANAGIPIFMAHGTADPVVQIALARKSRSKLEAEGYAVEWREYPMQHNVVMEEIEEIGQWLVKRYKSPIILA